MGGCESVFLGGVNRDLLEKADPIAEDAQSGKQERAADFIRDDEKDTSEESTQRVHDSPRGSGEKEVRATTAMAAYETGPTFGKDEESETNGSDKSAKVEHPPERVKDDGLSDVGAITEREKSHETDEYKAGAEIGGKLIQSRKVDGA